eukprot:TRINITY_DN3275_c0_g1_i5.p1 TRINITY_DN3275_c0_g1~~TRINITY_DN3275_c0_g1_i5.p1  ORF type:complete len:117 (+),score=22.71 TRINITY_DN3275_c0_g1_i5:131-481(+)
MDAIRYLSLKNITIAVSVFNLVGVVLLLHSIFLRHYSRNQPQFEEEQLRYIEDAARTRYAMEPVDLIKRVKQIQMESEDGTHIESREEILREHQATELSKRLNDAKNPSDMHKVFH